MSSIYIHIPFCSSKCNYCNFFSQASQKNIEPFISALIKEIELQKNYLNNAEINTIYFGGGTPSILSAQQINLIIDSIKQFHSVSENAEITLEANPEHLSKKYLTELTHTPVNRLSIGVQSFNSEALHYLGRKHTTKHALDAIENALEIGFSNLSVDIIFGIPMAIPCIESDLQTVLSFDIPHISAYALTVEQNTQLNWAITKNKSNPIDENQMIQEFQYVMKTLKVNQFHQYEISNYCKNNQVSKHNSNYWNQLPYLGLGPSAHSFNLNTRQWNSNNITNYIQSIAQNQIPAQKEILTTSMQLNEYIMTSLRTSQGCSVEYIENKFGQKEKDAFCNRINQYYETQKVELHKGFYSLTNTGILLADLITADLFV